MEMGYARIIVGSDSLVVIQALRGSIGSSRFHLGLNNILALISPFDFVVRSFVTDDFHHVKVTFCR